MSVTSVLRWTGRYEGVGVSNLCQRRNKRRRDTTEVYRDGATVPTVPEAVYVLLIAGVALVGYVVVPGLVKEVQQLSHKRGPALSSWRMTRVGCHSCSGDW